MPTVTVIQPTITEEKSRIIRCAAYCRVSSDSEDQLNSFMAQLKYYENFLAESKTETLINVYADDGISGTNTKKREEFNRMIEECMAGYIDMVITKSISRFARNTLDCLWMESHRLRPHRDLRLNRGRCFRRHQRSGGKLQKAGPLNYHLGAETQ